MVCLHSQKKKGSLEMRRPKAALAAVTMKLWSSGLRGDGGGQKNKITVLDFRRADFRSFRYLLKRVTLDKALEERGTQES